MFFPFARDVQHNEAQGQYKSSIAVSQVFLLSFKRKHTKKTISNIIKGMEIVFDVQSQLARALAQVTTLRERDLPFVAATAINMTMKQVKADIRDEMTKVFDRPTPFTLNSLQTYPFATKDSLEAVLKFRDFAGKGTPAGKYLDPEMYGGTRRLKSFEKALQASGLLPAGMYAVPAKAGGPQGLGAPLDQYGNIKGSYLNNMLSYLRANRDSTQNRAGTKGKAKLLQWFVIAHDGKGLPAGIYERKAGGVHMVLKYVRTPKYSIRFPFGDAAQASAARNFGANVDKATQIAVNALDKQGANWNVSDLLHLFPLDKD